MSIVNTSIKPNLRQALSLNNKLIYQDIPECGGEILKKLFKKIFLTLGIENELIYLSNSKLPNLMSGNDFSEAGSSFLNSKIVLAHIDVRYISVLNPWGVVTCIRHPISRAISAIKDINDDTFYEGLHKLYDDKTSKYDSLFYNLYSTNGAYNINLVPYYCVLVYEELKLSLVNLYDKLGIDYIPPPAYEAFNDRSTSEIKELINEDLYNDISNKLNNDIQIYDQYKNNLIRQLDTPIIIYFNICCINNWESIITNIYEKIKISGLYSKILEIRCIVSAPGCDSVPNHNLFSDCKTKIILFSSENHGNSFESIGLDLILRDAQECDDEHYVLYLHSKGVSDRHQNEEAINNVTCWNNYMLYFLVEHFELAYTRLKEYDAVGVNLNGASHKVYGNKYDNIQQYIKINGWGGKEWPYHFSGNFWWSKFSYIRLMNKCDIYYPGAEIWITSGNKGKYGKFLSLWNAHTDLYNKAYTRDRYEHKQFQLYEKNN